MTDGDNGRDLRSDEQAARARVSAGTGSNGSVAAGATNGERPRLSGGHQRDVAFVALLRAGDPSAFGLLFDTWIDPLYDRISHRSFTTADVAELSSDSFAAVHRRLTDQGTADPFRVVLFRAARQETIAAADRRVDLHMPVGPYAEDRLVRGADPAGLATDPAVAALLWQAADVLGEQARDVLDLHHRHDFSPTEIAAVMNLTPDAIEDILRKVPKGLTAVVRAMVVWRQGSPAHDELAASLGQTTTFETGTVRTIAEHQRGCEQCRNAAKLTVDPLAVFKAIPLVVAPVGFKEIVVERLHAQDLPVDGSVSYRPAVSDDGPALAPPPDLSDPAPVVPPMSAPDALGSTAALGSAAALGRTGAPGSPMSSSSMSSSSGPSDAPRIVSTAAATLAAATAAGIGTAAEAAAEGSGSPWDPLIRPVTPSAKAAPGSPADGSKGAAGTVGAAGSTTSAAEGSSAFTSPAGSTGSPGAKGAGAALAAAGVGGAAGSAALSGPGGSDSSEGTGNRKWLIVAVAVAALLLLIGGFALTQGGKKSDTSKLTATAPESTTTSSTTASSSSSVATTPVTDPATSETVATEPTSTDSTVTPTTKAGQTPVTKPGQAVTTTTAEPFPIFTGTTFSLSKSVLTAGDAPPTLSWNVKSDKPVTVSITGPGGFSSTSMNGGPTDVCPVPLDGSGNCSPVNGVYSYRLVATYKGQVVFSKTVQFTSKHL